MEPVLPTDDLAVANPRLKREGWSIPLLILLAMAATLPGWLPRRVFISPDGLDRNSVQTSSLFQTTVAAEQLRKGQLPLWNPSVGLGEPLLERGLVGVFAPTILPHLLLEPGWTWTLSAAMKLAMAGIGLWMLAGRYHLHGLPRLMAAALYMLGAFNFANLDESMLNLMPWLPWSVFAMEWLLDRVSIPRFILVSFIFAGQFFTGDPAASICLSATLAAALFFNLVWRRRLRAAAALPALGLAMILAFALAGVQWVPILSDSVGSGWPMPAGDSSRRAMVGLWSLPVWMVISLLIGIAESLFSGGAGGPRFLRDEKRVPSAQPLKNFRIIIVVLIVLLVTSIARHRGVSLADFNAARLEWSRSDATEIFPSHSKLPLAWSVTTAKWFTRQAELEAQLSASSFDPLTEVLFNDADYPNAEWINRILPDRHKTKTEPRSFWNVTPKVESAEQSGNQIRVRLQSGGTGWVIVSRAFAEGWNAMTHPTGAMEKWSIHREQIVLPADGKLLAVPVAVNLPVEIVLEYWPVSFRRGLLVSGGAMIAVVLLLAFSLSPGRQTE